MSASLADSAARLPAWRMGIRGQAGSLTSDSPAPPKLTIDHHYPAVLPHEGFRLRKQSLPQPLLLSQNASFKREKTYAVLRVVKTDFW